MFNLKHLSRPKARQAALLFTITFLSAFFTCSVALSQESEKKYISDMLFVPLRSGQGNEFRIIHRGLKSGTELEVIGLSEDGAWSNVKLSDGKEGWIPNQYLMDSQSARTLLAQSLTKTTALKKSIALLKNKNQTLSRSQTMLTKQLNSSGNNNSSLQEQYDRLKKLSANAVELDDRYRDLLEKHEIMQAENEILTVENDTLKNDRSKNFMFYGAGLLILGMILSSILPMLKPKKRYSEWS